MAGISFAMIFSALGSCYGTAKSGAGIAGMGVGKPQYVMKALIPVVMAGILGVYGLVISVLIASNMSTVANGYPLFSGALHFAAGLCVGLTSLAAGYTIGIVGNAGVIHFGEQPRLFVGLVLILIFAEVLGLYGLITGIILITQSADAKCGA
jgi:V-type H+-transporting ATPase proteolipid subunit